MTHCLIRKDFKQAKTQRALSAFRGVCLSSELTLLSLLHNFGVQVPKNRQEMLSNFLAALFKLYVELNFVYMEINPIVVVGERITPLDMAAKIDETAAFLCGQKWGEIDFPAPFGEDNF